MAPSTLIPMPENDHGASAFEGVKKTESALVIPVPEAEPVVGDLRARFDPAAPAGVPAHITVLYPFLTPEVLSRPVLDELRSIFSGVKPFAFKLTKIDRFPDVVYLVPEPGEPFIRLTAAVATRWPETPPYGGEYPQVIPHLTVAHTDNEPTISQIIGKIEPALPIVCSASEVGLLTSCEEQWTIAERFPFQGGGEN